MSKSETSHNGAARTGTDSVSIREKNVETHPLEDLLKKVSCAGTENGKKRGFNAGGPPATKSSTFKYSSQIGMDKPKHKRHRKKSASFIARRKSQLNINRTCKLCPEICDSSKDLVLLHSCSPEDDDKEMAKNLKENRQEKVMDRRSQKNKNQRPITRIHVRCLFERLGGKAETPVCSHCSRKLWVRVGDLANLYGEEDLASWGIKLSEDQEEGKEDPEWNLMDELKAPDKGKSQEKKIQKTPPSDCASPGKEENHGDIKIVQNRTECWSQNMKREHSEIEDHSEEEGEMVEKRLKKV